VHVQHHLDAATSEVALASLGIDAELSLKQLRLCDDDDLENAAMDSILKAGDLTRPYLTSRGSRTISAMLHINGMILSCLDAIALSSVWWC